MKEEVSEKMNSTDLMQSLEDLKEIRKIVQSNEEVPILAYWGFWTWAVLIAFGSVLQYIFFTLNVTLPSPLLLWLPVILVGAVGESLAWYANLKKFQAAVSSRRMITFYTSAWGLLSGAVVLFYFILQAQGLPVPGMLVVMFSLMVFFIAQYSFATLFIEGAAALVGGVIFCLTGKYDPFIFMLAGLFCGMIFFSCGLRSRIKERKFNG